MLEDFTLAAAHDALVSLYQLHISANRGMADEKSLPPKNSNN
jgi:hypothetical protein